MSATKIMVVDDDETVRDLLRSQLEHNGFKVLEADNGQDTLKLAASKKPKVILLDLHLPGTGGLEVCKTLTSDPDFEGRVIMISAEKDSRLQLEGFSNGASDFVTKPFDERILVAKVSALLRDMSRQESPKVEANTVKKGDFKLDENTRTLWLKDQKVCELTEIQFRIFKSFLDKSPECVSRQELFRSIFGNSSHDIKLIDIHLHNLKIRLGRARSRLKNIYGRGYQLVV